MNSFDKFCKARGVKIRTRARVLNQDVYTMKCTITYQARTLHTPFRQGVACDAPTAGDVLGCLILDACSTRENEFPEWCREYGYDDDSIKALSIYNQCWQAARDLGALLKDDYNAFVNAYRESES